MGKAVASIEISSKRIIRREPSRRPHPEAPRFVQRMNPRWDDLAKDWENVYKPELAADQREIPRPAGENAGLQDDAAVPSNLADKTPRSR